MDLVEVERVDEGGNCPDGGDWCSSKGVDAVFITVGSSGVDCCICSNG